MDNVMDNVITLTSSVYQAHSLKSLDNKLLQPSTVAQEPNQTRHQSVEVIISSEARDKLAQEKASIGKKIAEQLTEKNQSNTEKVEESSTESLDTMIEQIEEQITEINEKLNKLNNDKSEEAAKERDALTAQLMSLQATLISLIGKKLDAVEAEASA